MEFLAQKHIHHGDLATRNILLTDSLVAKISDFGLSRRLYEDLSEPQPVLKPRPENNHQVALPIKWLAPEVLMHHSIIPEKSDVWSYGVMAWEVFALGADPYRKGNYSEDDTIKCIEFSLIQTDITEKLKDFSITFIFYYM